MKKTLFNKMAVILVSLVCVGFASCSNDGGDSVLQENEQEEQQGQIPISGIVSIDGNPIEVEGLTVKTFFDDSNLTDGKFEIESFSNNLPQLVYLTDTNDNTIMMARDCFSKNEKIEINEESTALALISMYPLFVNANKDNFSEIAKIITESPKYQPYLEEVKKCIYDGKDIFDVNNMELLVAMSNVIEDICQNSSLNDSQTRAIFTRASTIEGITSDPFDVTTAGNSVVISNQGLVPTYECEVYHGARLVETKLIEARSSYGFMDLFQRTVGNAHLGDTTEFVLANEGEYRFYFDRTTERAINDFSRRLWADALTILGFDTNNNLFNVGATIIKDIATLLTDPTTDFSNVLATISGHLFQIGTSLKWSDAAKVLNKLNLIYNAIKGTGNETARIIMGFRAPYFVDFCLCQYNNTISTCTESEIEKVSGDNQDGFAGQKLLLPLVVSTKVFADDGTEIERSTYQKVKFEVVSGGGKVDNEIVGTEIDSKTASTYWTLGDEGEQQVKAVVVDMVTGIEVSSPVYFTATLRENADLTIRLDWNKLSGNTDIDLHVTDPYGEEIAFYNMRAASGGWLDRDDVVGPGPEHICWSKAPAGAYLIQVHYYSSETQAITSYTVTINANGQNYGPFTGSIAYHQMVTIGVLNLPSGTFTRSSSENAIPSFLEQKEIRENVIFPYSK